jgi:predicted nucleotidyltransferase
MKCVSKPFSYCGKRILNPRESSFVKTEKDYEEFLSLLNKHKVRYCIIGSFAVAFHARPRYTKDIDILVEASADNAKKILKVLDEFGFGSLDLSVEDLTTEGNIIQLGYEPVRIDIMTSIKGLDFSEVWRNLVTGPYGEQTVNYIDRQSLIKLKKLSDRIQDKADLELLLSDLG